MTTQLRAVQPVRADVIDHRHLCLAIYRMAAGREVPPKIPELWRAAPERHRCCSPCICKAAAAAGGTAALGVQEEKVLLHGAVQTRGPLTE